MNIVTLAPSFCPVTSVEAYCSTRFASALAKAGHAVHVAAAARLNDVKDIRYEHLVHPAITVL